MLGKESVLHSWLMKGPHLLMPLTKKQHRICPVINSLKPKRGINHILKQMEKGNILKGRPKKNSPLLHQRSTRSKPQGKERGKKRKITCWCAGKVRAGNPGKAINRGSFHATHSPIAKQDMPRAPCKIIGLPARIAAKKKREERRLGSGRGFFRLENWIP